MEQFNIEITEDEFRLVGVNEIISLDKTNAMIVKNMLERFLVDEELIQEIKDEMRGWFAVELTDLQIYEYLFDYGKYGEIQRSGFDTVEREDFINWIAEKTTGMDWPMNGSSKEYTKKFYDKLFSENSEYKFDKKKYGYEG